MMVDKTDILSGKRLQFARSPSSRVKGELKTLKHNWGTIQKLAQNRQEWRSFVTALHA